MQRPSHYLVIDVEATCSENDSLPRNEREIIEIGAVVVESLTFDPIDEFQCFIQPIRHPNLTPFCIELTSITQGDVMFAERFPAAMARFGKWLKRYPSHLFCSWGEYDRIQFQRDCRYHRIEYPFTNYLNLKKAFAKTQRLRHPVGMSTAMRKLRIRETGIEHRGIDDARNIAKLLPYTIY